MSREYLVWEVNGVEKFLAYISDIQDKIEGDKFEEFLEELGTTEVARVKTNIVQERDSYNRPWQKFKHKPSKKRGGDSAKLLRDTGTLINSVSRRVEKNKLFLEAVDYAQYHQDGNDKLPKRAIFPDKNLPIQWQKDLQKIRNFLVE